jgi:hypothetical protein
MPDTLLCEGCDTPLSDCDEDLLWAIERILQDFMSTSDFNAWMLSVKDKQNGR